jgi:hypothetical protein
MTAPELSRRQAGAALVEAIDVLLAALPRTVELAREEERAAERAAVVAWLRKKSDEWSSGLLDDVSGFIESGWHRREGGE